MGQVIQHVVDASSLGGLYALYALGIGLIFGVARIVNFAHGELIMVGAYVVVLLAAMWWPLAIVGSVLGVMVVALLMERVAFRPLRGSSLASLLVAAFAVSVLVQNVMVLTAGRRPRSVAFAADLSQAISIGGVALKLVDVITIGVTVVLLTALVILLHHTTLGLELRAAAENFMMARLLGVRANRVIASAFIASGLLAAVAGMLRLAQTGAVGPTFGTRPVLIGFIATIIGGMGSLVGAVVGGFVLGSLAVVLNIVLPGDLSRYSTAFLFTIVIGMLLFRPGGLVRAPGIQERV